MFIWTGTLPYYRGRTTLYSDRYHYFSVSIPGCYKNVYFNSFFPSTERLWNSLSIEIFPLSYDLNGFKCRIKTHLLTVDFLYPLIFLCFFPSNSMPRNGCSALHGPNPNIKKCTYLKVEQIYLEIKKIFEQCLVSTSDAIPF